jgi:hypothetical protein
MQADRNTTPADQKQIELLEELVGRARTEGIRTGIRNDEIEDLTQAEAAELIEQLQRRLGVSRG